MLNLCSIFCFASAYEGRRTCAVMKSLTGLDIRLAKPDDAEVLHNFICDLACYEQLESDNASTIESLRAELADEHGVLESAGQIHALIVRENKRGIETRRIVIAGFSQGGAIALHVGLRSSSFRKRQGV